MSTYNPITYLFAQIKRMIEEIKVPGLTDVQIVRKLEDIDRVEVGIRLLRRSRQGKAAVIFRDHQGNAYLCSIASDILKPRDLRFLMSSSSKVSDYFYHIEEAEKDPPASALSSPLALLEELRLLGKKFRADKTTFPVPACVERLRRVRRFARHLDRLIAKATAHNRKALSLSIQAQRALERSNTAADRALRTAARIDML